MQRGITGNERHPADWERQRERLSAYLDGALAPAERAALESHLADCPACQGELADLRALRALLRAMPAPALPRSFLLPEDGAVPVPLAARGRPSPATVRSRGRGPRAAEWVGALVASLGLALLLGSAFANHGATSAGMASAPQYTGAEQTNSGGPSATSPAFDQSHTPALGSASDATNTAVATKGVTPAPAATYTTQRGGAAPTSAESVPPILPIGGAGLFIGGSVVFVVGRTTKRRPAA
jgi:anti-sigma factor RsiW